MKMSLPYGGIEDVYSGDCLVLINGKLVTVREAFIGVACELTPDGKNLLFYVRPDKELELNYETTRKN